MRVIQPITEIIQTTARNEMVDITQRIQKLVTSNNVTRGYALLFVPHTTAGLTINENADPTVRQDILAKLEAMVPKAESYYRHAEGNSDAHVKSSLMGHSLTVLIDKEELILGQWQGIYLCEFDGPRERRVVLRLVDLNPVSNDNR